MHDRSSLLEGGGREGQERRRRRMQSCMVRGCLIWKLSTIRRRSRVVEGPIVGLAAADHPRPTTSISAAVSSGRCGHSPAEDQGRGSIFCSRRFRTAARRGI